MTAAMGPSRLWAGLLGLALTAPAHAAAWFQPTLNLLLAGGVRTAILKHCPPRLAGQYQPADRVLELCPAAFDDPVKLRSAITHETVHAIQHCIGIHLGRPGPQSLSWLMRDFNQVPAHLALEQRLQRAEGRNLNRIALSSSTSSNPLLWQLEREAYALENDHAMVLSLFRRLCIDYPN